MERLGEGGMGTIYRVRDHRLGREAALKMINQGLDDENMTRRFLREAEITARLVHPAIPPVHEAGLTVEGQLYILMRVIEGKTLTDTLQESECLVLDRRKLIEVLIRAAEAVAYAHTQGVVHRDLKPDNIMIGDFGEVMLMDWGIAKDLTAESGTSFEEILDTNRLDRDRLNSAGLTLAGAIVGTPGYMSPEQLESGEIDGQADVYSLGLILSEVLTGEPAITGQNTLEMIASTLSDNRVSPKQVDGSVPKELDWIAQRATKLDRTARTESASLFIDQLKAHLAGELVPGYPYNITHKIQRFIKRHSTFLLILAVTLVFGAVAALLVLRIENEKQRIEQEKQKAQQEKEKAEQEKRIVEKESDRAKKVLALIYECRFMVKRGSPTKQIHAKLEEALVLGKRSKELLLTCAQILDESGDLGFAKVLLEELVKREPPAYRALFQLHHIELKEREVNFVATNALFRILESAIERGDENEFTLFAQAVDFSDRGELPEAIKCLDRVEEYTTTSAWTYGQRGQFKSVLGEKKEALKDFNKAISIDPKFSVVYYNRAMAYQSLGEIDKALNDYSTAIQLKPNFAEALVNRGNIMASREKSGEALEDYKNAIRANPKLPQGHYCVGVAYFHNREYKRALPYLDQAIRLKPKYSKAYHSRGNVKSRLKNSKGAFEDYCKAIECDPKNALALYSRAVGFYRKRKFTEAMKDCRAAIKAKPSYTSPYVVLGQVLFSAGKTDEAIVQFDKTLAIDPQNHYAYFNRGRCWQKKRDVDKAISDYSKTIQYKSNHANAYLNRASLLEYRKKYKDAIKDWQKYRKLSRSSSEKKRCDANIKRLTQKLRSP